MNFIFQVGDKVEVKPDGNPKYDGVKFTVVERDSVMSPTGLRTNYYYLDGQHWSPSAG